MLSHVQLFATPWTVAHLAPLSIAFSRQEYWSGLPFPSPGNLPNPGIKLASLALQVDSLPLCHLGSSHKDVKMIIYKLENKGPWWYLSCRDSSLQPVKLSFSTLSTASMIGTQGWKFVVLRAMCYLALLKNLIGSLTPSSGCGLTRVILVIHFNIFCLVVNFHFYLVICYFLAMLMDIL